VNAKAGWLSNFCSRHLIADDPYQWEGYSRQWLEQERARLQIKANHNMADRNEKIRLMHIKDELRIRDELSESAIRIMEGR